MDKNTYTFMYSEQPEQDHEGPYALQKRASHTCIYSDDVSWTTPLLDFAQFLSGIYGYDIVRKIRFDDPLGTIKCCSRAGEYSLHKDAHFFEEEDFDDENTSS